MAYPIAAERRRTSGFLPVLRCRVHGKAALSRGAPEIIFGNKKRCAATRRGNRTGLATGQPADRCHSTTPVGGEGQFEVMLLPAKQVPQRSADRGFSGTGNSIGARSATRLAGDFADVGFHSSASGSPVARTRTHARTAFVRDGSRSRSATMRAMSIQRREKA